MKKLLSLLTALAVAAAALCSNAGAIGFEGGQEIGEPLPPNPPNSIYGAPEIAPALEDFPAEPDFSPENYNPEIPDAPLDDGNAPTSGSCGDSASWSFDRQSGLLMVSGQGAIYDYDYDGGNYAPWYAFREEITDILISSGITSIGNNAFRGLAKATGVNIPAETVRIGNDSFTACHSLTDVSLPDGITSIGYNAFNDTPYIAGLENEEHLFITPQGYLLRSWSGAEKIIVPNEVKVIASWTFFWAPCLSAEINSDCFICNEAFYACTSMTDVVVNGNCHYEDGSFVFSDSLVNFEANGDVTSLGSVFKFSGIQNIIINGSLLEGGLGSSCNTLKTILITGDCNASAKLAAWCGELESISIGGNLLDGSLAYLCNKLKTISITGDCNVSSRIVEWCDELESVYIGGNLNTEEVMLSTSKSLKTVTIGGNCTLKKKINEWCDNIETITVGGDLIVYELLTDGSAELQNVTIGGGLELIGGSFATNCPKLKKITYNVERSSPIIRDNTTGKTNIAITKALRAVSCLPDDPNLNTYSDRTDYNNGFGYFIPRRCAQEIEAPDGIVYVACGVKDVMQIASPNSINPILEIRKQGFDFAAACIDNEYNWYIMWSYKIPNEVAQEHLEDENIVIAKYTFNGQLVGECKMKVKETSAPLPLDFGSASMAVKDNILGVFYNTVWLNGHQGAEFAAINKESMELVDFSGHQGSHAFGTMLLPTKNGFTGAHLGDAYPRGIAFHSYYVSGSKFSITSNGPVIMHSSGNMEGFYQDTHTHMGGLAVGNTTYAVAGKAERCYTSGNYEEFKSTNPKGADIFDVFVRIVDQTLLDTDDIGGEDRIDAVTSEIADTNVFWLTSCNSTVKAGQVKVVTLESGAYCVLWERMVNGKFDSIRYVIMDEYGNILRRETAIYGARLSNTSIQPIVSGSILTWAIADAGAGTVTWYTVNLEAFGDVNEDGSTTLDDAVLTLQSAMNVNVGTAVFDEIESDINCDGQITLDDAVEILKIAMNVIT